MKILKKNAKVITPTGFFTMKKLAIFKISLFVIFSSFHGYNCIIGGKDAEKDSRKYVVSFRADKKKSESIGSVVCSGSILNETFILTSAFCVDHINLFKLNISYGSVVVTELKKFVVNKTIKHPYYNTDTLENNIALVTSETPFDFPNTAGPVRVSLPISDHPSEGGINSNLSGFGYIEVSHYIMLLDAIHKFS